jgi:flagellar motor switch protein FliG
MPAAANGRRAIKFENLSGRQKCAILLMTLGPQGAPALTQSLTPEEIEALSLEIAQLDEVPPSVVERVLEEWFDTEEASFTLATGGVDAAREILRNTLGPEESELVLSRIESQLREGTGFHSLRHADPSQLANVLRNEHVQTIALIMAHLETTLVAEVVRSLKPEVAAEVMLRMARMEKVHPEVLEIVERSLGGETNIALSRDLAAAGGPAAVAAVLNLSSSVLEKELLDGVGQRDPELVDEIKALMFIFEDIIRIDDRAVQKVVQEADVRELARALKGASEELKEKILGCMSQRAKAALEQEMEFMGPTRLKDVEASQAAVVKVVRDLESAGELVISTGSDDDVLL